MKFTKFAPIILVLLSSQAALAGPYSYRVLAKGVVTFPAQHPAEVLPPVVVPPAATPPVVIPPVSTNNTLEGSTLVSPDGSLGPRYGAGVYYSDKVVDSGVVYFEVHSDSGTFAGDSLLGFVEASHTRPTNNMYFTLGGQGIHPNGGVFDASTFANQSEYSPYVTYDVTGAYAGPAIMGFSANFHTRTIKIYYNNALKYTITNLPPNIALRAATSWKGSGVAKFNKASWSFNPEGL